MDGWMDGLCMLLYTRGCMYMCVNESGGGWSVVDPMVGVMEGSGGVSVECVWERCVGPQQVLLVVANVGGRAGPGSVPWLRLTTELHCVGGSSCHQD